MVIKDLKSLQDMYTWSYKDIIDTFDHLYDMRNVIQIDYDIVEKELTEDEFMKYLDKKEVPVA